MSLYSLLALASFMPLVFGGDKTKYRLSSAEDEWSTKKWASHKYDDDKYYDDDNYRSSKQWQRPKYPSKDAKEWKKDDYTKGNVYSHGSYSMHKDEPVKDDWKKFDSKDWKKDDGKYGSKYQPQKYDSKQWKKYDYKPSDWKKGHSYSYKGNYDGSYSMNKDVKKGAEWKKDDGKYGSKYSKSGKDKKEYPSKDDPKHKASKYDAKDHKDDSSIKNHKDEPKDYKIIGKYGRAYSMRGTMTTENNVNCPSEDDFDMNAPCDYDGECSFGEESCCGQTFASLKCLCGGERSFCFYTDACFHSIC